MMRTIVVLVLGVSVCAGAHAVQFTYDPKPDRMVLLGDGKPWLTTMTAAFEI